MLGFSLISQDDIAAIHGTTLKILNDIGISITEPKGIEVLTSSGAKYSNGRAYIPPDLVSQALNHCPSHVSTVGRNSLPVVLGSGELHWHNLGGARDVYLPLSNSKRPATIKDIRDSTRLLDSLDMVSTVTPMFTPQDVPGAIMSLAMYRYALPNTVKPLQGPGLQNDREVEFAIKMAEVVGKPSEILTLSVSPISPLRFPDEGVRSIIRIAKEGVTFGPLPCPTAGTTAPMTLAGALAQQNAEVLASIVLAQLIQPGLPIIYCGRLAMMEPRTGLSVWGGVEMGLASAATVQVAHFYKLPVNVYGFSTNSHHFDIQNGFERITNAVLPALAGADELSGIGEMEAGISSSFAQIVMDDEIAKSIRRILLGISVDEERLGLEIIRSVIESSGNFLVEPHTSQHLRKGEMHITQLAERGSWEQWERTGFRDMSFRAHEKAEKLINEHEVKPLDGSQELELDRILATAELELP